MQAVFLKLLNMSLTAGWLVLAVLLLRVLLKKAPKWIMCLLWGLVAVRLLCPVSLESGLSLIPSAEPVPSDILLSDAPAIDSGLPLLNQTVNPVISQSLAPAAGESVNPLQIGAFAASAVWLTGTAVMLLYALVSFLRLRKKVREGVPMKESVWLCDHVDTPFILGMVRPRIYLPSSLNPKDMEYVIAHEKAHLRRKDHLWKPVGFFLLAVYWFHPLMWVAYVLFCKDVELACDEKVLGQYGVEIKKPYAEALVNCSVPHTRLGACPLAFGEVGVKERVKGVLHYKKPAFWLVFVAVIACVITAVCLLTDPPAEGKLSDTGEIADTIQGNMQQYFRMSDGTWKCDGQIYAHRLEISGTMPNSEADCTYVYLSNLETIPFEKAWKAAGFSSAEEDYFSPDEAVLVEIRTEGTLPSDSAENAGAVQIEALLETICSSPAESSAPGDYIKAHRQEYDRLVGEKTETLKYCFSEFLKGGQTDLRGHIMALACQDIMALWQEPCGETEGYATGQQWFDRFQDTAIKLSGEKSEEELKASNPGAWLLLNMLRIAQN